MSPTLTADATVAAFDMAYPSIFARIAARVCARHLDRLVEAGASPEPGSTLDKEWADQVDTSLAELVDWHWSGR